MPPSFSASVSHLELFRVWQRSDHLPLSWLLMRLRGELPPTVEQQAGQAFHAALEALPAGGSRERLQAMGYRFDFCCETELELLPGREFAMSKRYGDLTVRGRVDLIHGRLVVDYKTSQRPLDAERLMASYQWRFYLDIAEADRFRWVYFLLEPTRDPKHWRVIDSQQIEQVRYPALLADCTRLAESYTELARRLGLNHARTQRRDESFDVLRRRQ